MIDLALTNDIIVTQELDAAVQELDILFGTTQTELLGDVSFGSNFYKFLWEVTPTTTALKEYIQELISKHTFYVKNFKADVEVEYTSYPGQENEYVVQITLTAESDNKDNKPYRRRIYNIQ